MSRSLTVVIVKGVAAFYGLLSLAVAVLYSLTRADTWRRQTENEERTFESACKQLWSLSNTDNGLSHNFLTLQNGLQMHYLSTNTTLTKSDNLIIFLHGFPDTCYLWENQLRSNLSSKAKLVALDLPGCGGSDSHSFYGPDQILNAVAEAIVQLKSRYWRNAEARAEGKAVLVSHDWGGAIAFRLAGETSGLFDEVVVLNSTYPLATRDEVTSRLSQSRDAIYAGRFGVAWSYVQPVCSQLLKSNYIFMLNLRLPLAKWMPWLSSSLVKLCHEFAYRNSPQANEATYAKSLAASYGPSPANCATKTPSSATYGPTVLHRSKQNPQGDWDERVRLYSEGLALGKWHPTFPGYQAPFWKSASEQVSRKGQFSYPMHVMFGMQDVALDPRIVLDGLEGWMLDAEHGMRKPQAGSKEGVEVQTVGRSSITKLWRCGHWVTADAQGARALIEVLETLLRASR